MSFAFKKIMMNSLITIPSFSDIFDNSGERSKYSLHDSDYGSSNAPLWNLYNLDLSPITSHDNTDSTSSYIYDVYNPKNNNNLEEQYYTDNNYPLSDWDGEYFTRQRGNTGSYSSTSNSSGSSSRSKKVQSSTSKRATSKVKAKSKTRTLKRSQQLVLDLNRDLTPPPAKQI